MKTCATCKLTKPEDDFPSAYRPGNPVPKRNRCKVCWNRARRERRRGTASLREKEKRRAKVRQNVVRSFRDTLYDSGCCVCGEKEKCCLQLHHTNPETKEYEFSKLMATGTITNFKREFDKGAVVVCANCHFKIHAGIATIP